MKPLRGLNLVLILVLLPLTPLIAAEERFINVQNIQIVPPGEDVPKETAAFSGVWEGEIADQYGSQPQRLYVLLAKAKAGETNKTQRPGARQPK